MISSVDVHRFRPASNAGGVSWVSTWDLRHRAYSEESSGVRLLYGGRAAKVHDDVQAFGRRRPTAVGTAVVDGGEDGHARGAGRRIRRRPTASTVSRRSWRHTRAVS